MESSMRHQTDTTVTRIYTQREIEVGTVLGGPFVAGYFMYCNYKVFQEPEKARTSLLTGLFLTVLLSIGLVLAPAKIIRALPKELIPLVDGIIAYWIVRVYQARRITEYVESGGRKASGWRVAGMSLVGTLVFAVPVFILVFATQSSANGTYMTFGRARNEIYYDPSKVTKSQVKYLGNILTGIGLFRTAKEMQFQLKESKDTCDVLFAVADGAWRNPVALKFGQAFRDTLQEFYPSELVILDFAHPNFDSIKARFTKTTHLTARRQ